MLLLGTQTANAIWDVPKEWLNYTLHDNLAQYKVQFAKLSNRDLTKIDDQDFDFQQYLIDEKLRLSTGPPPQTLTVTEWRLFKMAALGYPKETIIEQLEIGAYHVFLANIRNKLGLDQNYNKAQFLLHALRMQIPEVVNQVEEQAKCRITYL